MSTTSTITRPPGSLMHDPPHPGEVLREGWLTPLGLSVTTAAEHFGISRKTLSEILNGQAGISATMALRLSKAFDTTPEHWMSLQAHYDLWHARQKKIHVRKFSFRPRPARAQLYQSAPVGRKAALHRKAPKSR